MTDLTQYDPTTDEIEYIPNALHPYKSRKKTWEQIQYKTKIMEQLTQREKIPGTPFTLIWQDQHGWFIVMGDHRLTEPTPTKQEQIEKLETNKWELITTVVISVVERLKQYEELQKAKPYETNSI